MDDVFTYSKMYGFEAKVVKMVSDEHFQNHNCSTRSEVCVTLWRALYSLISVRYKGLCAEYLAGPEKKGGLCTCTLNPLCAAEKWQTVSDVRKIERMISKPRKEEGKRQKMG